MERVLMVSRINPHCGCSDKAFYTLIERDGDTEKIMGSDEFPYKNDTEFNLKLGELEKRFKSTTTIIEP